MDFGEEANCFIIFVGIALVIVIKNNIGTSIVTLLTASLGRWPSVFAHKAASSRQKTGLRSFHEVKWALIWNLLRK